AALPYDRPGELVALAETMGAPGTHLSVGAVAAPNFLDWKSQRVFADAAAYMGGEQDLGDVANPERLRGRRVTTNLFQLLGAKALVGRTLEPSDEPTAPVVVISEGLWRRRFGADRALIGSTITLSSVKHTVVGVMP